MKVKGTAIKVMVSFIVEKFGNEGYQKWLDSLSSEVKDTFSYKIFTAKWFPLKEYLIEPTKKMCEIFYNGDLKGAWDVGRFSSEHAMKGVYKYIFGLTSLDFLIDKAPFILKTYYNPCNIEVYEKRKNGVTLRINYFPEIDKIIEYRIGGWIERTGEMKNMKNVMVKITNSLADGDPYTEIIMDWTK